MLNDLTGKKFGYLTVLEKQKNDDKKHSYWLCRCDCGNIVVRRSDLLKDPRYKSCGCYNRSKRIGLKHGKSRTKLYHVWAGMKNRCESENNRASKWYHDKGIKVCKEWMTFEPFYKWATSNGYEPGLTIDRIDVNGNYEPSNCRWLTIQEQSFNTSRNIRLTHDGHTFCLQQWAKMLGVNKNTFWRYIRVKNMTIQDVIEKCNIKCIDYPERE